jgi:hypothetical protein
MAPMNRMSAPAARRVGGVVAAATALAACSPTFDWRETGVDTAAPNAAMRAMFPCKPDRHARPIELNGQRTTMQMAVCAAGGATFALSAAEVANAASVGAGLQQLRAAAVANLRGETSEVKPWQLAGMTPSPESVRLSIRGQLPDGAPVIEHAALFVQGLMLYQASVIGAKPDPEAVETFFAGLKFVP